LLQRQLNSRFRPSLRKRQQLQQRSSHRLLQRLLKSSLLIL